MLDLKRNKASPVFSAASTRPWETIFSGSSHMLPPLTKLCSEFLESLLERRTAIVEWHATCMELFLRDICFIVTLTLLSADLKKHKYWAWSQGSCMFGMRQVQILATSCCRLKLHRMGTVCLVCWLQERGGITKGFSSKWLVRRLGVPESPHRNPKFYRSYIFFSYLSLVGWTEILTVTNLVYLKVF